MTVNINQVPTFRRTIFRSGDRMSGPDPFRPKTGSNGIGGFVIGVSPIGDIPPFDFWKTIISQYANSDVITHADRQLRRVCGSDREL